MSESDRRRLCIGANVALWAAAVFMIAALMLI